MGVAVVLALVAVLLILAVGTAGWVASRRITARTGEAVDRVRIRAQLAQTRLMPAGPRRDAALLRQRLDAQVRAARAVLGAPGSRVFRADAPAMLSQIMTSASELDAALSSIDQMTLAQQQEALPAITPQVEQLITTTDTACRTLLRTRAETRSGQLASLDGEVGFEAASLETYERERNDLQL